MSSYRLTRRADQDLIEIYLYTLERFGIAQADRYTQSIKRCFERLASSPGIGRTASSIRPGTRRHEHDGHVIFYRPDSDGVLIQAVIHHRMRPDLAVDSDQ